jgi:hypothetical protein
MFLLHICCQWWVRSQSWFRVQEILHRSAKLKLVESSTTALTAVFVKFRRLLFYTEQTQENTGSEWVQGLMLFQHCKNHSLQVLLYSGFQRWNFGINRSRCFSDVHSFRIRYSMKLNRNSSSTQCNVHKASIAKVTSVRQASGMECTTGSEVPVRWMKGQRKK